MSSSLMQAQSLIGMDPDISAGYAIINTLFGTFNDASPDIQIRQTYRHLYLHYEIVRNLAESAGFRAYIQSQAIPPIINGIMRQIQTKTRSEITSDLLRGLPNGTDHAEEAVNTLLTFIIRVWLMCRIGDFPGEPRQGQISVPWLEESTLSEALGLHFRQTIVNKGDERLQLEKAFKACNFERYGGIRIIWTSNLLDHLRLHDPSDDDEPYQLLLFHHVGLLEYHQEGDIFPEGLVEETLRTLALLLPKYDLATAKWFKAQLQLMNHSIDSRASHCKPLDPSQRSTAHFRYWGERLTILKNAYEASEPRTVTQWWSDRRRRVQWATFWVAALVLMLTVFFGVIQSVEGALQVYKAYHPS